MKSPATNPKVSQTPSPATVEMAFAVKGMDCASCVAHVEKAARAVSGVEACSVNLARARAVVTFDPTRTDAAHLAEAISNSGYPAAPESPEDSPAEVEAKRAETSRHEAAAWFRRAVVGIALWLPVEVTHWIMSAMHASGHAMGAGMSGDMNAAAGGAGVASGVHLILSSGAGAAGQPALSPHPWMDALAFATGTAAILYVGAGFYRGAWGALRRGGSNMDTLIAMGATVAYGYSVIAYFGFLSGAWGYPPALYFMEASGLLALISLGHWLEARSRETAGSAIRQLLNLSPATALRVGPSGEPSEILLADLRVGDRFLVRPGDRVAVDGVVAEGRSSVDESMITGEAMPVLRRAGETVIGGTQNVDGRLTVRATKVGRETALAQIVALVEKAQSDKPQVQRLADQIAAVFVPCVLGIALITAIGWYAFGAAHGWPAGIVWARLANAVCSVVIIACPCALGLALPAAIMVGAGMGARRGILIRDIEALQHAEKIDVVVLDKTGTVTRGKPSVTDILPEAGESADELLRLAASSEQFSGHPLAKAVTAEARRRKLSLETPDSFTDEPGLGVIATLTIQDAGTTRRRKLLVGNEAMLQKQGAPAEAAPSSAPSSAPTESATPTGAVIHVAEQIDGGAVRRLGRILLADRIKPDSVAAIAELHRMGIETILLTGDSQAAADAVAREAGIHEVRAGVKPDEKAAVIRQLQNGLGIGASTAAATSGAAKSEAADQAIAGSAADKSIAGSATVGKPARKRHVVMVGDGINDAPALAAADLGIAIGSGADVAKETGGIVLVSGSLLGVSAAIKLSRATMRTIRRNLVFACLYNVLAIPLAAFGVLNPLISAGAMALSDVTVIGSALLLRRVKLDPTNPPPTGGADDSPEDSVPLNPPASERSESTMATMTSLAITATGAPKARTATETTPAIAAPVAGPTASPAPGACGCGSCDGAGDGAKRAGKLPLNVLQSKH